MNNQEGGDGTRIPPCFRKRRGEHHDGSRLQGRQRGRARDLRDLRRPRAGDDLPLALPARAARAARLPDPRRRSGRLERRGPARPRSGGDRRDRRATRRGGLRAAGRPPLLPPGRLQRRGDVSGGCEVARRRRAAGVLPRDPAVPLRQGRRRSHVRRSDEERPDRRREAVRPRPRVRARPRRGAPRIRRRVADLPHRPLPREDGAPGDPLPALCECDARATLEPQLRRGGADHDGRELRRADARPLLRPGRRPPRRRRQPPDAARRGRRHGAALPPRPERDQGRGLRRLSGDGERRPARVRARPGRGVPLDSGGRSRLDHGDVRGPPARRRQLALGGRAVLHPHRQGVARHPDRGAPPLQALPQDRPRRRGSPPRGEPARDPARPDDGDPRPPAGAADRVA